MSVKEMYMGREMTGTTTLAESVYNEMGGDTPLITESRTVKGVVNELKTIEGTEAYDNTATYAVGDYCIYNSTRYKCITAVTTAEDFDSTKWSATTTNNDISELNSSLNNLKFIGITVNDTTNAFGNLTINNPTGSSAIFLLRNTYTDSVTSSFGVINVDSTSPTSINLRFRTLSDGAANANAQINTTLIFAYK